MQELPLMAIAAWDILAIPGSEVDYKRLFCGGKDQLGVRRHATSVETMRWTTLLKSYFERKLNKGIALLLEVSNHFHSLRYWLINYLKSFQIASNSRIDEFRDLLCLRVIGFIGYWVF
jgi:hypothetical protein